MWWIKDVVGGGYAATNSDSKTLRDGSVQRIPFDSHAEAYAFCGAMNAGMGHDAAFQAAEDARKDEISRHKRFLSK